MNDRSSVRSLSVAGTSDGTSPESSMATQPAFAWETVETRGRALERLLAILLTTVAFAVLFFLLQPFGLEMSCFGGLMLAGPMTPFFHELVSTLATSAQA